jgi:hypothetical protein
MKIIEPFFDRAAQITGALTDILAALDAQAKISDRALGQFQPLWIGYICCRRNQPHQIAGAQRGRTQQLFGRCCPGKNSRRH